MTAATKKIQQEIRQLPLEEMLELHEALVESIHEKEEIEHLDPAFQAEILRRVGEIDSGKIQGEDAFEALKKM